MWFYWLEVVDNFKYTVYMATVILIIVTAIIIVIGLLFWDEVSDLISVKILKRMAILIGVTILTSSLVSTFVPSRETLIQMKVAELATYENVDTAIETTKDLVDYVLDEIDERAECE
jgi:undecaprenyl pyrophosphate phosphatase UppP